MEIESQLLYQYATPSGSYLQPKESSKHITSSGYELCPGLIKLVQEHIFSRNHSENPYSHLADFEQTCSCLKIKGIADETLRWKLFPFSLTGRAKKWYNRHVGNSQGDWDILGKEFCLKFFLVEKAIKLWFKIIGFKQLNKESLGKAWT
jgi:hypothetical protein